MRRQNVSESQETQVRIMVITNDLPLANRPREHVWQTTRPYRCNICLFGFGRDKTRAIHVKERKKGCKRPPPGSSLLKEAYEHSPEAMRDRRIDAARSTEEIMQILDDYDREKGPNASPPREEEHSEDEEGSEVGKPYLFPLRWR